MFLVKGAPHLTCEQIAKPIKATSINPLMTMLKFECILYCTQFLIENKKKKSPHLDMTLSRRYSAAGKLSDC